MATPQGHSFGYMNKKLLPTKFTFSPLSALFRQVGSLFRQVGSLILLLYVHNSPAILLNLGGPSAPHTCTYACTHAHTYAHMHIIAYMRAHIRTLLTL